MAIPSFIFNAQTTTPEELAQRRALAQALLNRGQTGIANNIGEGLAQFGQALAGRLQMGSVNRQESAARNKAYGLLSPLLGGSSPSPTPAPMAGNAGLAKASGSPDIATGIVATANALGIDPVDLGTAISYETAGTFDPTKAGPRTQWGQHKGLIQFGEPQAKQYGVDWNNPVNSQLGPDGAVAKYLKAAGVKPGMGMMDVYSAINAGRVGRNNASDANNGGAPGTVADKVNGQMTGHRAKAQALLASVLNGGAVPQAPAQTSAMPAPAPQGTAMTGFPPQSAPMAPQIAQQPPQAPQIVPTAGPAPVQQQMAAPPQGPMSAYQRMVMTSLGKDGGIDDPRNRAIAQQAGLRSPSPAMVGNNSGLGNNSITAFTALPQGQPPQAQQMPVQGGGRLDQLRSILMSPSAAFLDDTTKQILVNEYKMELERSQPPDPMKQIELEKSQIELNQLKNPQKKPILVGDTLVDPDTFKPLYTGGTSKTPKWKEVTLDDGVYAVDEANPQNRVKIGARPDRNEGEGRSFQQEKQFRTEYMKESQPFADLRTNYSRITAASQDQTGASDIAMVYSFMKMLDPTSVVREGEFATAENAGGIPQQIQSLYNKAINGQRLAPEVRADFIKQAKRQYDAQLKTYGSIRKKWQDMAAKNGLNAENVAPDIAYGSEAPMDATQEQSAPPQDAVQMLMIDPSQEAIKDFDEVFGPGAARRVLQENANGRK